jgi:phosphoglycolate phosphatase
MTPTPAPGPTVADLIAQARYLLLDFDGPICDTYAGLPAAIVADRLRKLITGQGITMPADILSTADPLDVFTYSATVSPGLAARVEAEMADQELTAITTAQPTPYVHEVITSCRDSGRQVAVVSNNADRAVHAYLTKHGLADRITAVAARTSSDPTLLKPSPHLIQQAISQLRAQPAACVLVGDSTTDAQAATLAGIPSTPCGRASRDLGAYRGGRVKSRSPLTGTGRRSLILKYHLSIKGMDGGRGTKCSNQATAPRSAVNLIMLSNCINNLLFALTGVDPEFSLVNMTLWRIAPGVQDPPVAVRKNQPRGWTG